MNKITIAVGVTILVVSVAASIGLINKSNNIVLEEGIQSSSQQVAVIKSTPSAASENFASKIAEPTLSPEQIRDYQFKRDNIGNKLISLAQDLEKNIDNEKEKQRIKQEFQVLTTEYNQIAIQLFKAGSQSSVAEQL